MSLRRRIYSAVTFIGIPLIYTLALYFTGGLSSLENYLVDLRYRHFNPGHKISDKIAIVEVDESSLATLAGNANFGRWPWKRSAYPPILEYLVFQGGARMVLMDILFSEISADDGALVASYELFPNVSHAVQFRQEELQPGETPDPVPAKLLAQQLPVVESAGARLAPFNRFSVPIGTSYQTFPEELPDGRRLQSEADWLSFPAPPIHSVTYRSDADGVGRRLAPLFPYEIPAAEGQPARTAYFPALALRAYDAEHAIQKIEVRKNQIALHSEKRVLYIPVRDGQTRLHYYDESEIKRLPRYSVAGILASQRQLDTGSVADPAELKVNPLELAGKLIIFGTTAAGTHDTIVTPYGEIPGLYLHAVLLSNLLNNEFLYEVPNWVGLIIMLVMLPLAVVPVLFSGRMVLRILLPTFSGGVFTAAALLLFQNDIALPMAAVLVSAPVAFLAALAMLTFSEGAEKRKYSRVLSNMVDPTIVREALHDLETLKRGGTREITAFFSDVAGFSTISEQLSSADLAALLNEYLSAMTVILKHNFGTLDKYIGDAIVGIFGAPVDRPQHYLEAARASLEMLTRLDELKAYWKKNDLYIPDAREMSIRIGLNTGPAKVGFMGTESLASYTMMGDTVNLASRLEAAGKDYGVHILVSHSTKEKIESEMFTRLIDAVVVKGKTEPVRIYELIGVKGQVPQNLVEAAGLFEEGFARYLARDWDGAVAQLRAAEKARGSKDKAAAQLIERCEEYRAAPPPAQWNGAFVRTHK